MQWSSRCVTPSPARKLSGLSFDLSMSDSWFAGSGHRALCIKLNTTRSLGVATKIAKISAGGYRIEWSVARFASEVVLEELWIWNGSWKREGKRSL
jgi:hypothetical protein